MPAIRQELRPPDGGLLARRFRLHRNDGAATRSGDAVNRIGVAAVVKDDALRTPAAIGSGRRVADLLRRAAADVDLLQLTLGHERDEAAVRRPERSRGAIGAGQWVRGQGIELPDPDPGLAFRVGRVEREISAVRRQSRGIDRND